MPTAQQNPKVINARLIAALMAGSDTGNACEAEAMNKFRALRRMASDAGLRIVDVLELPDVRQAIDDQMRPARQENGNLQKALEQAAALREELTERTRNVRELAELVSQQDELLKQQKETATALREELAATRCATAQARTQPQQPQAHNVAACAAPVGVAGRATHSLGAQSWVFEVGAVVAMLIALVMSVSHGRTVHGQNGNPKQRPRIVVHDGSAQHAPRRAGTAGGHIAVGKADKQRSAKGAGMARR